MALTPFQVMASQQAIAYAVLICGCVWYVYPWLKSLPEHVAVPVVLVPFLFRFVGIASMVFGVVGPEYPVEAQRMVLIGDSVCPVLALVALGLYRYRSRFARAAAWILALQSFLYSVYFWLSSDAVRIVENLHAHWYVGAVFVPIMYVNTVLLMVLLRHQSLSAGSSP